MSNRRETMFYFPESQIGNLGGEHLHMYQKTERSERLEKIIISQHDTITILQSTIECHELFSIHNESIIDRRDETIRKFKKQSSLNSLQNDVKLLEGW